MGFLEKIKEAFREPTKYELEEVELYIYSARYFQENIERLISSTMPINNRYILETYKEEYNDVWKYDAYKPKKATFAPEPKNQEDSNAIKIMVNYTHIGYIPTEENIKFKKWMDGNKIYNTNLVIYGGDKKVITKDGVETIKGDYRVTLRILLKTENK